MTALPYPFQGMPAASSLAQSIVLAQLTILRRINTLQLQSEVQTPVAYPSQYDQAA